MVEYQLHLLGSRVRLPAGGFAIFFCFCQSFTSNFPFPLPSAFHLHSWHLSHNKFSFSFCFIVSSLVVLSLSNCPHLEQAAFFCHFFYVSLFLSSSTPLCLLYVHLWSLLGIFSHSFRRLPHFYLYFCVYVPTPFLFRESTHRHQQVCFWPDVSTFIETCRNVSKRVETCRNVSKRVETSGQNQTCWCLWVLSLKLSPSVMPFKPFLFIVSFCVCVCVCVCVVISFPRGKAPD